MAHLVISIPGETAHIERRPKWTFTGGGNVPTGVTIRYLSDPAVGSWTEIAFSEILECRWIKTGLEYSDHTEHVEDRSDGLVEIVASAYIAAMDARGVATASRSAAQLRQAGAPLPLSRRVVG
jgi:hypothetical protein